jgi:hypothetical protein
MERFRLRTRLEPRRGQIWELHLFPAHPRRCSRETDARVLGSVSAPVCIQWLRRIAEPYLLDPEAPEPIAADKFRPGADPRWIKPEGGMRLALAFSAARWLTTPGSRTAFAQGLLSLPSEVILYWFTMCFYGYRQAAARAALRTLLTHSDDSREGPEARRRTDSKIERGRFVPSLFPVRASTPLLLPERSIRAPLEGSLANEQARRTNRTAR